MIKKALILIALLTTTCFSQTNVLEVLFREGSGTTVDDSSPTGGTGSFNGTPTWNQTDDLITGGYEVSFDNNAGDNINFGDDSNWQISGSFSISVWAEIDAFYNWGVMIGKGNDGEDEGDNHNYYLTTYSSGIRFGFEDAASPGSNVNLEYATSETGTWRNWTAVFDAANDSLILYRDGVRVDYQVNITELPETNTQPLWIGALWGGTISYSLDGQIHYAAIWDGKLSASQVDSVYNNTPPPLPAAGVARRRGILF